jgi:hypothetical protein
VARPIRANRRFLNAKPDGPGPRTHLRQLLFSERSVCARKLTQPHGGCATDRSEDRSGAAAGHSLHEPDVTTVDDYDQLGPVTSPPGAPCRLDRVVGGGRGVGAAGWCPPFQDTGFWLLQPPAFGLFAPMVMPAERTVLALLYSSLSWEDSFRFRLSARLGNRPCTGFLTAARPYLVHGPARHRAQENPAHKEPGGICDDYNAVPV